MPGMPATPATAEPIKKARRSRRVSESVRAMDLDWSTIETGRWLWAGTRVDEPYPCMCQQYQALMDYTYCGKRCPCAGRTDTGHLPDTCCAIRRGARPRTVVSAPVPLPPLPSAARSKLRPPRPVTAADVLVSTLLSRRQ